MKFTRINITSTIRRKKIEDVLGAIVGAERAQPVAWLARNMGGNRQNVHRIVNDLQKMGLVTLEVNPHHRQASLVVLTDKGRRTFDEASRVQAPWADALSEDPAIRDIDTTRRVVAELRKRLELNGERAST